MLKVVVAVVVVLVLGGGAGAWFFLRGTPAVAAQKEVSPEKRGLLGMETFLVNLADAGGTRPFDALVIGAGMFGGYCAEKLYRLGGRAALRILVLDAGAFLLQSHIQNLPQQLGGKVGGPNYLRMRDDASGAQNVIWGMPWGMTRLIPSCWTCAIARTSRVSRKSSTRPAT